MLPERDHITSHKDAAEYTERYRRVEKKNKMPHEFQFHNDQVQDLIAHKDAAIFCVAPGYDATGNPCMVLGVRDKEGKEVGPIKLELSFPYP